MTEKINHSMEPIAELKKRFLWAILATLCFSMLANGYSYFNFYPIHDAVDFTIGGPWREWQVELGRFLIPLYYRIKTPISMPFITGLLSMAYRGASVFLIAETLGQRSRLGICLISGFLSANLFMLEINTAQQYFSDVFLFSLLFACLGIYCVWVRKGWKPIAAAVVSLLVSYGMYPAFITFAACLCILAMVFQLIEDEGFSKVFWRKTALCITAVAVAGLAYMICNKVGLLLVNSKPSTVNWSIYSIDQHNIRELWEAVKLSYKRFYRIFFIGKSYVGIPFGIMTCLLAAISAALVIRKLRKRVLALLCIVALLAVFPPISRLVNIFTDMNGAFRTMFAQFLIWPALVALIFRCLPAKSRYRVTLIAVTGVMSIAIILGNVRYSNGAFTIQRVLNERAKYHTGRVLEDLDGYDKTKKLVLLDRFYLDAPNEDLMKKYRRINGFGYDTGADGPYEFVHYAGLMGYKLDWDPAYAEEVMQRAEIKKMPAYPEEGYIMELDDYLVVRLGNEKVKKRQSRK